MNRLFAVPVSSSLTDTLAERFGTRYRENPAQLSELLFLVPNRRTAVSLKDAFIRFNGKNPLLLPRILPVGDITQDDVFFLQADTATILENLPAAIDDYERLFLFARLIISRPKNYGLPEMTWGQAFSLAKDLAKLSDTVYSEHLSLNDLKKLVPDQYATHWQETLTFLQIVMSYWPKILEERGVADQVERQEKALRFQIERLRQNPPKTKIIAAGLTGSTPVLRELIQAVFELPEGEVYLYNLDRFLDDDVWQAIDENHPQYFHKMLLEFMKLDRQDVKDCVEPANCFREALVSETMRPAKDTWHWLDLRQNPLPLKAVENIHLLDCTDTRQEALAIALILRDTLNTPEKTAALVTPDRDLARRTAAELERWNIRIDDSAGKPLHLKPVGIFLRLIVSVLENQMSEASMLSVLKNPLTRLGKDRLSLNKAVRLWEKAKRTPRYGETDLTLSDEAAEPMKLLQNALEPLAELYRRPLVKMTEFLKTHLQTAEKLAGAENLWRGEDGRAAAALFDHLLLSADSLGEIDPEQYASLLTAILSSETVRSEYASHPRIKILGPIEARFNHFDTVIIGGVNEGNWPEAASADPWLSRPMKKEFGMPLPEISVGVLAADFCQLLCAPEVYVTSAARSAGTPINKSRWLLRLETVLDASGFKLQDFADMRYIFWADLIDQAQENKRINPPEPCPPVSARPRSFSASKLEVLMSDPYEIFAEKILRLKPLDDLDPMPSAKEYGTLVHHVLEKFVSQYSEKLPEDIYQTLETLGREEFDNNHLAAETKAFWWPAFLKTADWFATQERTYRRTIVRSYPEVSGSFVFEAPAGPIRLEARADRLDLTQAGTLNVVDYKTGQIRTNAQIESGYAPQLPLEGIMAQRGCFVQKQNNASIPAAEVEGLTYWQLGKKVQSYGKNVSELLEKIDERLRVHLAAFDLETTAYVSRPNPKHSLRHPNYEHLARVKEWMTKEDESDDQ
jgi:ATP-dependent helicase/nuclease subunit B